jgi:hypothetical protein
MRESRTYGSVRGAPSNGRPYRDPEQGGQDHQPAIAILHIGRCHQRMQQQPQRIDQDVTLLALDQLAGIEPM